MMYTFFSSCIILHSKIALLLIVLQEGFQGKLEGGLKILQGHFLARERTKKLR